MTNNPIGMFPNDNIFMNNWHCRFMSDLTHGSDVSIYQKIIIVMDRNTLETAY